MTVNRSQNKIKVRKNIFEMGCYNPPLEDRNPEDYILMDFNEPPLPPPDEIIEKITFFLKNQINTYPRYSDFLKDLGKYVGVDSENLLLTNGSDQAVDIIFRCLLEEGDEVKMVQPGFTMFNQVAKTLGCSLEGPQFKPDFIFPHDDLKSSIDKNTSLIVIINPNNPTGTSVSQYQIEDLLLSFPNIPILVDEAYYEFTGNTSVPLLKKYSNLIVIRTFSKALGIPGLRLGYVVARKDFVLEIKKIRGPYDVNAVAILAASEQLKSPKHWQSVIKHLLEESRPALVKFFDENDVKYYLNEANFLLVEPKDPISAYNFLKKNKILVRLMKPPISHTFRMSLRMMPDMKRFMEVYRRYLKS